MPQTCLLSVHADTEPHDFLHQARGGGGEWHCPLNVTLRLILPPQAYDNNCVNNVTQASLHIVTITQWKLNLYLKVKVQPLLK